MLHHQQHMAMKKLNSSSKLVISVIIVVIILSLDACIIHCQHLHHHPSTFLLDLESASTGSDVPPIVCHGDSLNNNFHRNQHPVKVITEDADLFIGALLNVHDSRSGGGFFSCGNITQSGLIAFEALNWISSTINQEHGLINGKPVIESFIPGVRIGKLETCVPILMNISSCLLLMLTVESNCQLLSLLPADGALR